MKLGAWFKQGVLIKRDRLKFGEAFQKGGRGSFAVKHFHNGYKNLVQTSNFILLRHNNGFIMKE